MTALVRFGLCLLLLLGVAVPPEAARAQSETGAAPQEQAPAARLGRSGLPLPRFVSLRAPKVNMRTGPGIRYPIDWVYSRAGLPLEVIEEFETWRRVRDWEGSVGWVHQSMLSGERNAMVVGRQRLVRREPAPESAGVALVEAGVIGRLLGCDGGWCRIEVKGFEGWIRRSAVYGVYPDEAVR
ncbi:MAG: SH3 domain-containing protein [Kiloniellaceae bacterium]